MVGELKANKESNVSVQRNKPLIVVVTAPKGGPGKTMLSMLLGYASARMGLRTLVVGCGIANDEHADRMKLMLTQIPGRIPTLRDRPYPQQWARDPVTGYMVVPGARSREERTRELVLSDVRWLVGAAEGHVDVILLDAPPPESDQLTSSLLGLANVLLMVLSHDTTMQQRALEDVRALTNSSAGRPVLDPTQVRCVFSCLNADVSSADIARARERFDTFLWLGHVPYHQAVWRGDNAGDLFGSAPTKVLTAADAIARQILGVLAVEVPPPAKVSRLRRRRHDAAPKRSVGHIEKVVTAAATPAAALPAPTGVPLPPPSLADVEQPSEAVWPPSWPELRPEPPEISAPVAIPAPTAWSVEAVSSRRPRVLLEVFATPLPKVTSSPAGLLVPEGVSTVTPFLLAAKGRPQDIGMLVRAGIRGRSGKRLVHKSWENVYKTPDKAPADAIAVKANGMITLEPGVVTEYQWIAEVIADAHDGRRPVEERVNLVNTAVFALGTLAGEAYGGSAGAENREWAWAHEHDWLDGRNTPVLMAQSTVLNAAVDVAGLWQTFAGEAAITPARAVVAMLLRLDQLVLPGYAPWALLRAAVPIAVGPSGSPADRTQAERRVRELVAAGELPDEQVVNLLGF